MKVLLAAFVASTLLLACGDDDDDVTNPDAAAAADGPVTTPDGASAADGALAADGAPVDAPAGPCDPLAQTGCPVGEKCTWITLESGGEVGCVPEGAGATGAVCTAIDAPAGGTTDDCASGHVCLNGVCERICATETSEGCDATSHCRAYAGLFDGSTPALGACDFLCDPVSQRRAFDDAEACGSANPAMPRLGCYGTPDGPFGCAAVPAEAASRTHEMEAFGPMPGSAFLNGCAPGYAPFVRSSFDSSSPIICVALCRPDETSAADPAGAGGVVGSGFTCGDRGAAGAECRFVWFLQSAPTAATNDIGFCWTPANYVTDWDMDPGTPDTGAPECASLPDTDTDGSGVADHAEWACAPYPP